MKLDLLAIAAHPDDAELGCSGAIIAALAQGKKAGIIDLTRGEMGTRGSVTTRDQEAAAAAKIMGLSIRENLNFKDIYFSNDPEHQVEVVKMLRKYQPNVVITGAIRDRHPDHAKGSALVKQACFMSGLSKLVTDLDGHRQEPWRPSVVYHFIQSYYIVPDLVVDISEFWERKMQTIKAFKSQFFDPGNTEPETYISSPDFMKMVESRAKEMGHSIGAAYGEGFTVERNIGVKNLLDLI